MAAINVSGPYPNFHRVTLADATKWYEFTWDPDGGKVSIYSVTNTSNVGTRNTAGDDLADGDTFVSATDHYGPVPADAWHEMQGRGGLGRKSRGKVAVNPGVNNTVVVISVEAV